MTRQVHADSLFCPGLFADAGIAGVVLIWSLGPLLLLGHLTPVIAISLDEESKITAEN